MIQVVVLLVWALCMGWCIWRSASFCCPEPPEDEGEGDEEVAA